MGACIESVATARGGSGRFARSARRLTEAAARACLRRAGHRSNELDLLVNVGIYKDKNMAEPALASIIQQDIDANPGHPVRHGRHGTFSFDVLNGGSGALTAAHLVDVFVAPGSAGLGLIVAGDVDPAPRTSSGFPFASVAGAVLLKHTDAKEGFERFEFRTFPAFAHLFEARLQWERGPARNAVEVYEDRSFADVCVECAAQTAKGFLEGVGVHADQIDVLVASQYPPQFPARLARAIGIAADCVPPVAAALEGAHTAGPLVALESAIDSRIFARGRIVLFVTAGAGITIGVALYRTAS